MTETDHNRVNYLAVVHGQHVAPPPPASFATANAAHAAGCELASQCLSQLEQYDDPKQFPPRLLILLASAAYLEQVDAAQLLTGIQQAFAGYSEQNDLPAGDVPLLGCSVAAVVFKHPDYANRVHEQGALLICLASRLITAEIAVGHDARQNPEGAIQSLLTQFDLSGKDPNPLADRVLLSFFPGFGKADEGAALYPAPELHRRLRAGVRARIRIAGGVASANNPVSQATPVLFAGRAIHTDAVVAARVTTGVPIGIGLDHGLTPTGRVVRVSKLGADKYTIAEFDGALSPVQVVEELGRNVMMGKLSTAGESLIGMPLAAPDKKAIRLFHEVREGDYYEFLRPEHKQVLNATVDCVKQARESLLIKTPLAVLLLICNAWRLFYQSAGMDIEQTLAELEAATGLPCMGGFVDGEAGEDVTGRSVFGNGGVAGTIFGDEMRERTPLHKGFQALSEYGPDMTEAPSVEEAIKMALRIVVKAGYSSAMLSLILKDGEQEYVKAVSAKGERFGRIVSETKRLLKKEAGKKEDVLAHVARTGESLFIRDARTHPLCNKKAARKAKIISHYVIPLRRLQNQGVLGVLQVDLGNTPELNDRTREVLESLAAMISATLNRLMNWFEASIRRELDAAMLESLAKETLEEGLQHLIQQAVKAFHVEMGHIRLADNNRQKLVMAAGVGDFYEAAVKVRHNTDFDDNSPIGVAFKKRGTTIRNDTKNDESHKYMLQSCQHHPSLVKALKQIKSYATIAFEDEEKEALGALSLYRSKEWGFLSPHKKALEALGQRAGFLVGYFRNKRMLQFVIKASPRLSDIVDLSDFSGELSKAVERFCGQARARWGSLYLLDEDRQCYVLRAQYGWQQPEWVHAARYDNDHKWVGAGASASKPNIISDLYEYHKELGTSPRYMQQAFGFELSPEKTVESIGLLLQVGGKRLGFFTMHRPKDGALSGFAVRNRDALLEGASDIAGLVHVMQTTRERQWREGEARRRQNFYRQLTQPDDKRAFETKVCQEMLKSFHARQAHFYRIEQAENETRVFWVEGYRRLDKPDSSYEKLLPPEYDSLPLKLVKESVLANLAVVGRRPTVKVKRFELNADQRKKDTLAAAEGLVIRACVPIISKNELFGILDLHWTVGTARINSSNVEHDEGQLLALGSMVGSAYRGNQEALEIERSKLAAQGAGAHAFQYSHRLGNKIQNIQFAALKIKQNLVTQQEKCLSDLLSEINQAIEISNDSITGFSQRLLTASLARFSLHDLLEESLLGLNSDEQAMLAKGKIKLVSDISKSIVAYADFDLVKDALVNLLNNAIRAIQKKCEGEAPHIFERDIKPTLMISAETMSDRRDVEITISDCGTGMSEEQINWALAGFYDRPGRRGVGVLIAKVLLNIQGGQLKYESSLGVGTQVRVTLPLADKGERLCLQIPKL
ncbi:MAG: GAF domain-containing protein [Acidobacteria bacterium]|nr:GAF domain-containing protein [Acidobacteriota bacterium]MBI3421336.1 GAF domain-containing protein [Acidobacteriota bacterium]